MSTHKPFITIGYFGVPGRTGGMTHLVNQNTRRPLCGQTFHPEAEYQWCFPHWQSGEPECERCKKAKVKLWAEVNYKAGQDFVTKALAYKAVKRTIPPSNKPSKATILGQLDSYFGNGGLFNPEMMDHDKVRDLLRDCQEYIANH